MMKIFQSETVDRRQILDLLKQLQVNEVRQLTTNKEEDATESVCSSIEPVEDELLNLEVADAMKVAITEEERAEAVEEPRCVESPVCALMREWEDCLDAMRSGSVVLPVLVDKMAFIKRQLGELLEEQLGSSKSHVDAGCLAQPTHGDREVQAQPIQMAKATQTYVTESFKVVCNRTVQTDQAAAELNPQAKPYPNLQIATQRVYEQSLAFYQPEIRPLMLQQQQQQQQQQYGLQYTAAAVPPGFNTYGYQDTSMQYPFQAYHIGAIYPQ